MKNDLLPQTECNQDQVCNELLLENKQSGQEIFLEQESYVSGFSSMPSNQEESNTKSPNTNDVSETYTIIENNLNAAIYNESNSKPTLLVCEATKYSQESFDDMCKRE